MSEPQEGSNLNRRQFLKLAGATSATLAAAGTLGAGIAAGSDKHSYIGWTQDEGLDLFNREPFRVDSPTYLKVGDGQRIDPRLDSIFDRHAELQADLSKAVQARLQLAADAKVSADQVVSELKKMSDDDVKAILKPLLLNYYNTYPGKLQLDLLRKRELEPAQIANEKKYGNQWAIAKAWSDAYTISPKAPDKPPKEWDYAGVRSEPFNLISPESTTQLIKQIAYTFGATLVSIARLNHDWVYAYPSSRSPRGFTVNEPLEVPGWWEFAIVVTTPHEWDQMYANPTYGTSSDAYNRSSLAAERISQFIRKLGYPARTHSPNTGYDLMVPPIMVDSGMGEQGRFVYTITPELGANNRPAVVTTNLPLIVDRPVDLGIHKFCQTCKVCAESCPGQAITYDNQPKENRGYVRWTLDIEACYNYWGVDLGNGGCRTCLAGCPYTRKANWLHKLAPEVVARDPSGLAAEALTWMHKTAYDMPDKSLYGPPNNASYRAAPWWMKSEAFINF